MQGYAVPGPRGQLFTNGFDWHEQEQWSGTPRLGSRSAGVGYPLRVAVTRLVLTKLHPLGTGFDAVKGGKYQRTAEQKTDDLSLITALHSFIRIYV